MAVKTNGASIKRFHADTKYWPENKGTYQDETEFCVNGAVLSDDMSIDDVLDSDSVSIDYGFVLRSPFHKDGETVTLESYFRRWLKEQTTVSFSVDCDVAMLETVKAAVVAAGGKIAK